MNTLNILHILNILNILNISNILNIKDILFLKIIFFDKMKTIFKIGMNHLLIYINKKKKDILNIKEILNKWANDGD